MGFRPQAERATLQTTGRTSDLTQRATLQKPSPYGRLREWAMGFRAQAERATIPNRTSDFARQNEQLHKMERATLQNRTSVFTKIQQSLFFMRQAAGVGHELPAEGGGGRCGGPSPQRATSPPAGITSDFTNHRQNERLDKAPLHTTGCGSGSWASGRRQNERLYKTSDFTKHNEPLYKPERATLQDRTSNLTVF